MFKGKQIRISHMTFFSESHHDYIIKCIFVDYIDVGSFSILGARPSTGGGVLPKVHIRMRAHVCTHMC